MDEHVVRFDWEALVRPPFGVWHPVGGGFEVRVFATDAAGTFRVRHVGKVDVVHPDGRHEYWSTHCRHDNHGACSATELAPGVPRKPAQCKNPQCNAPCVCECHGSNKGV